jgi:hypothetical protein
MKLTYRTPNGRFTFEVEVPTGKAAFECVAAIQELFEIEVCGCCESKHIRHDVREFGGNKYFKMICNVCGAQLDFGQHRDGKGLFVKRRDENKQSLDNGGWYVYQAVAGSDGQR